MKNLFSINKAADLLERDRATLVRALRHVPPDGSERLTAHGDITARPRRGAVSISASWPTFAGPRRGSISYLGSTRRGATVYRCRPRWIGVGQHQKAAGRYEAEVGIKFGRAEFLGTTKQDGSDREQRDDARAVYEGNIRQSKVAGHDEVWTRVRDRWGQGIHQGEVKNGGSRAAVRFAPRVRSDRRIHALALQRRALQREPRPRQRSVHVGR